MTNTELLKKKIRESGYKIAFLAEQLGLSRQGFYLKVNNTNEFFTGEVSKLCELLKINSLEEREAIFFAKEVDK